MCFFPLRRCRGARHDGHRVLIPPPTPALPGLQLPGTALILLLIYAPGFSFESSTPCTFIQPSSPSLLYSLSLQPSLSLALPVRALPIYILNLCLPPLRLFNPHINPVYGLHHAAPVSHCCLIPLPSLLSHPLSSGCPRCGGRSLFGKGASGAGAQRPTLWMHPLPDAHFCPIFGVRLCPVHRHRETCS